MIEDCESSPLTEKHRGNCGKLQENKLYCCQNQAAEKSKVTSTPIHLQTSAISTGTFNCFDAKNHSGTCKLIEDCPHIYEIQKKCDLKRRCDSVREVDIVYLSNNDESCDEMTSNDPDEVRKNMKYWGNKNILISSETIRLLF